jgi:hypothetical protein
LVIDKLHVILYVNKKKCFVLKHITFIILLTLIPLVLSMVIAPSLSFGYVPDSPRHQLATETAIHEITCSPGKVLMVGATGRPGCAWEASAVKLEKYGWGTVINKDATIPSIVTTTDKLTSDEAKSIAEKAFIYAYPMLENYHTMYNSAVDKSSSLYAAPFNEIHNNKGLATPADKWVVTPNSDTIYSRVWLDLRAEPVILTVPPMEKDRYYTWQLVDFYTNNFNYIGTRTEGNNGGTYLIAGPTWDGKTLAGIDGTFQSSTDFVYALARTEVLSDKDVKNVLAIMDKYKLQTQSEFLGMPAPAAASSIDFIPWDKDKGYGSDFVNYFNLMLTWSKVPASEKQLYDDFAKIGIKEGATVDWSTVDPAIKSAIGEGAKSGFDKIKGNLANLGVFQNGWILEDAFGDADWRAKNYLLQATGDMIGLYGTWAWLAARPPPSQARNETDDS